MAWEAVLEDPPVSVLLEGRWYERGWESGEEVDAAWREEVRELLRRVPDDELLTAFDYHS